MKYSEVREHAANGDLLLLEGKGPVGRFIRVVTGQQISHVAMLLWLDEGLWVAEMRNAGYSFAPASQRIPEMQEQGIVYWGKAPRQVRNRPIHIHEKALSFRGSRYSWWSLVTVWCAQVLKRQMPRNLVCSTFVEKVWEAAGWNFHQTPDPGDFVPLCDGMHAITADEKG